MVVVPVVVRCCICCQASCNLDHQSFAPAQNIMAFHGYYHGLLRFVTVSASIVVEVRVRQIIGKASSISEPGQTKYEAKPGSVPKKASSKG